MSDKTTIARPYAKALFEHALQEKTLTAWSHVLQQLAELLMNKPVQAFVSHPQVQDDQQVQCLEALLAKTSLSLPATLGPALSLLAENKRLLLLPDIYVQFELLRAEEEKTQVVHVHSFAPLTTEQQQLLMRSLSERLQRQVTLDVVVDKSLLGGAIIRAGDLVIDGSVRGKLSKLGTNLAA